MSDTNMTEPAELRQAYDKAKADLASAQTELRNFKAEVTFEKAGLTPKHAELFLAANPDTEVTPEVVKTFADEYGLQPQVTDGTAPSEEGTQPQHVPEGGSPPAVERTLQSGPQEASRSLADIQEAAGSPQGTFAQAQPARMNQDQFQLLLKTNPDEAARAYAEGRVERNERNVQADLLVSKGVINQ
jgi:hypothetical protein